MVPKVSAVPKQRSGCANAPGAQYLAHTVAEELDAMSIDIAFLDLVATDDRHTQLLSEPLG